MRGSQKMPRMSLQFTMTPAQEADLAQLLKSQQDRRSPQYQKFLTPEQFAGRFGPKAPDVAPVLAWLEGKGFQEIQVARGGMWVSFSGTAEQAEAAFHVSMRNYSLNGETRFANATDPQLPKSLVGVVRSVGGLENFAMKPRAKRSHPQYTASPLGTPYLAPDDWATIYDLQPLYSSGFDGSGVTIAVVGQSDVELSDLRAFRTAAGLPLKDPTFVVPPGSLDPGIQNQYGDEVESDLDLEWAGAIARNANILFVTASATQGNGIFDSIAYVVDNNAAPIMTISYGGCEANLSAGFITSEEAIFQQASAEGITVLAASGDSGATACDQFLEETAAIHGLAVSYPASSQYVTAVGGTILNVDYAKWSPTNNSYGGSTLSYIPEGVWNDGFQLASGGGASSVLPKPAWQTGTGVPEDNARDVPDVAFAASPITYAYLICGEGWCTNGFTNSSGTLDVAGGTSASTPSFSGLLALVLQKGGANRLGNINTNLYSLAQISPNAFHDITSGSNRQTCQLGTPDCTTSPYYAYIGYDAGTGYDQASGLGSVDGYNFAEQWFGDFTLASNPSSLTIQPGSSATAEVSVVPQNNFEGQVTVTCSVAGSLIDVTCSVPSGPVGAGGSTTVTISAATTAKTPWWKRHSLPPVRWNWILVVLAILVLTAALYRGGRGRSLYQSSLYGFASVALVVIAVGSGSCGGGGSVSTVSTGPARLILTCNLPNATYGVAYSGSCSASGGTGPYAYSIYSGSTLPQGLTLNPSTGAVSGTPTALGESLLTMSATDSGNPPQVADTNTAISVVSTTLSVSCQLPPAFTGTAYTGLCTSSGGVPPFNYQISSGALPGGLTLNSTSGAISGTPMNPGTASFVVHVNDSSQDSQSATFTDNSFVVNPGALVMSCSLPSGVTGGYYSGACSTTGGSPPVAFSIGSGSLPAGLYINSNGQVGGDPMNSGTSAFAVKAVDSGSPPQTTQLNQNISVTTGQLTFNCYLSSAYFHYPYSAGCQANGGNAPYTFSIASGALPAGLTLNSSSGAVTGVPAVVGTSSFVVKVTDSSIATQTATFTQSAFVVQAVAPLTLSCLAQNLGDSLGTPFGGFCRSTGGNSPYTASVISGSLPPGLTSLGAYPLETDANGNNITLVYFYGTPTQMGTSTVSVQIADASVPALTATAQATFTIGPRPQESGLVTITATSGGITNTTTITVSVP